MAEVKPILVAEDDPNDRLFLKTAFDRAGVEHPLIMVRDGEEAMAYLSGDRAQHPLPCIVITDLKMPKVDGLELLQWISTQEQLRRLPVIVLSASGHECDIEATRKYGACAYFVKPNSFGALIELVRKLDAGWVAPHCDAGGRTA